MTKARVSVDLHRFRDGIARASVGPGRGLAAPREVYTRLGSGWRQAGRGGGHLRDFEGGLAKLLREEVKVDLSKPPFWEESDDE